MSIRAKTAKTTVTSAQQKILLPEDTIASIQSRWVEASVKTSIKPGSIPVDFLSPLTVVNLLPPAGSNPIKTCCDVIPVILVQNMPPSQYVANIREMVHFTIATMSVMMPEVLADGVTPPMLHMVTVTTAVRAGAWAALGKVPVSDDVTTLEAVRWSTRKEKMQIVPGRIGDGTGLWRHFLAKSTGLLEGTTSMTEVLAGLAPMLFLLGAAHVLASGEIYADHYVEKEIRETISKRMSAAAVSTLSIRSPATWDIMISAGLTGFTTGPVSHVAKDPAFIIQSQMRVARSSAEVSRLTYRLGKILTGVKSPLTRNEIDSDVDSPDDDPFMASLRNTSRKSDDTVSVADTIDSMASFEQSDIDDRPMVMRSPGTRAAPIAPKDDDSDYADTPRPAPAISPVDRAAIYDNMQNVHSMGPRAASDIMASNPDETVKW